MDARKVRYRLEHILEAIAAIESFVADKDFETYQSDRILHDAVERNLERLCEAARTIPEELKAEHPEIPWPQITGLGNVLRHAYNAIDDQTIWDTLATGLPPLKAAVESMIRKIDGAGDSD
ncbi:MAG: DUF86 domain-containing protein [Proteobacteria bacterium]|nr:DUF86 domain-containing protein [Pseudomonadota bacterium]